MLRYYEDLPESEVATIMGCSVGTVRSQTHQAVARLRELVGEGVPLEDLPMTIDERRIAEELRLMATEATPVDPSIYVARARTSFSRRRFQACPCWIRRPGRRHGDPRS